MSANSGSATWNRGRERPDLSNDYYHPQDTDASEPYLAVRGYEIALSGSERAGLVLELVGELDLVSTPNAFHPLAEQALAELANRTSSGDAAAVLAIDLSGVDFIDSAGLKEMVELKRRVMALPTVQLVVAVGGPQSQVQRVWNLGQFQTFILSRPTLNEVLTAAAISTSEA